MVLVVGLTLCRSYSLYNSNNIVSFPKTLIFHCHVELVVSDDDNIYALVIFA